MHVVLIMQGLALWRRGVSSRESAVSTLVFLRACCDLTESSPTFSSRSLRALSLHAGTFVEAYSALSEPVSLVSVLAGAHAQSKWRDREIIQPANAGASNVLVLNP